MEAGLLEGRKGRGGGLRLKTEPEKIVIVGAGLIGVVLAAEFAWRKNVFRWNDSRGRDNIRS